MRFSKGLRCVAVVILACPTVAWAQDPTVCECEHRSTVSATAWLGAATTSRHMWLGYVDDARMNELGIGLTWSHPIAGGAAIEAALTVLPYVRFRRPAQGVGFIDEQGRVFDYSSTTSARGLGFIPLDVGVRGFTRSRVIPSAGVFFGLVWFDRPIPNAVGEKRNYLFGLRGGLEVPLDPRNYLFAGARVQHLSYGGTQAANEGVENVMFRIGYGLKVRQ